MITPSRMKVLSNPKDANKLEDAWSSYWLDSLNFSNKNLIDDPKDKLNGFTLERKEWKMLNRFRSGHGCSASKDILKNL